jgi:hypothetical protein
LSTPRKVRQAKILLARQKRGRENAMARKKTEITAYLILLTKTTSIIITLVTLAMALFSRAAPLTAAIKIKIARWTILITHP